MEVVSPPNLYDPFLYQKVTMFPLLVMVPPFKFTSGHPRFPSGCTQGPLRVPSLYRSTVTGGYVMRMRIRGNPLNPYEKCDLNPSRILLIYHIKNFNSVNVIP